MKTPRTNGFSMHHKATPSSRPVESILVPFPDLPTSSPPRNTRRKRSQLVDVIPPLSSTPTPRSAPISLPESHIQRTPSELQLAVDTLHAEYKDVVMYSRLMTGMHHQIQQRCLASGGPNHVHPLSKKSMQGIANTKQANDIESKESSGDGWEMSHSPIDEEIEDYSIGSSPDAAPPSRQSISRQASRESLSSLLGDIEGGGPEDDCVFSLEL
ncbi:hypothetical protein ACHAXR_004465 [Thalassiosira sp. AJA248-18]